MNEELLRRLYDKAGGNPDKFEAFSKRAKEDTTFIRKLYDKAGGKPDRYDEFISRLQVQPSPAAQPVQEQAATPPVDQEEPAGINPALAWTQEVPGSQMQVAEGPTPDREYQTLTPPTQDQPEEVQTEQPTPEDMGVLPGAELNVPATNLQPQQLAFQEEARRDAYGDRNLIEEMESTGRFDDIDESGEVTATGREYQAEKRAALGEETYREQKAKKRSLLEIYRGYGKDGQATKSEYDQIMDDLSTDTQELDDARTGINSILEGMLGIDNPIEKLTEVTKDINSLIAQYGDDRSKWPKDANETFEYLSEQFKVLVPEGDERVADLWDKVSRIDKLRGANIEEMKDVIKEDQFSDYRKLAEELEIKQAKSDELRRRADRGGVRGFASRMRLAATRPDEAFTALVNPGSLFTGFRIPMAQSMARVVGNVGATLASATNATGTENAVTDMMSDFMMDLADDMEQVMPTPSNLVGNPIARVVDFDWFGQKLYVELDAEGNPIVVRDLDGYVQRIQLTDEEIADIQSKEPKRRWDLPKLEHTITGTLIDMGFQIIATKGLGATANTSKMTQMLANTTATAGMMMQSQYQEGLEMFDGDKEKASEYAIASAVMIGASSNMFGLETRLAAGAKNMAYASNSTKRGVRELRRLAKQSGGNPTVAAGKATLKDAVGEAVEETAIEEAIKVGIGMRMGGNPELPDREEVLNTAVVSLAVGALGGAASAGSDSRFKESKLYTANVMGAYSNLGEFRTQLTQAINDGFVQVPAAQRGRPTTEQVNAFVEDVAGRVEYVGRTIEQEGMDQEQAAEAAPLIDAKYDLQKQLKGSVTSTGEPIKPTKAKTALIEQRIEEIDKRINTITGTPQLDEEGNLKEEPVDADSTPPTEGEVQQETQAIEETPEGEPGQEPAPTGEGVESTETVTDLNGIPLEDLTDGEIEAEISRINDKADTEALSQSELSLVTALDGERQRRGGSESQVETEERFYAGTPYKSPADLYKESEDGSVELDQDILINVDDKFLDDAAADATESIEIQDQTSKYYEGAPILEAGEDLSWIVRMPDGSYRSIDSYTMQPFDNSKPAPLVLSNEDSGLYLDEEAQEGLEENTKPYDPNARVSFRRITDKDDAIWTGIMEYSSDRRAGQRGGHVGQLFGIYQNGEKVGTMIKHGYDLDDTETVEYTHLETGYNAEKRATVMKDVKERYKAQASQEDFGLVTDEAQIADYERRVLLEQERRAATQERLDAINAEKSRRAALPQAGTQPEPAMVEETTPTPPEVVETPEPEVSPEVQQSQDFVNQQLGEILNDDIVNTVKENLKAVGAETDIQVLDPDAYAEATDNSTDVGFYDAKNKVIYMDSSRAGQRELFEEAAHVLLVQKASTQDVMNLSNTIANELLRGNREEQRLGARLAEESNAYGGSQNSGEVARTQEFTGRLAARMAEGSAVLRARRKNRITTKLRTFFRNLLGKEPNLKNYNDAVDFMNNIVSGVKEGKFEGPARKNSNQESDQVYSSKGVTPRQRAIQLFRDNPNLNHVGVANALSERGLPMTPDEAFDVKMTLVETGEILLTEKEVGDAKAEALRSDPRIAPLREAATRQGNLIYQTARRLRDALEPAMAYTTNEGLKEDVQKLATELDENPEGRGEIVAGLVRQLSARVNAKQFSKGGKDIINSVYGADRFPTAKIKTDIADGSETTNIRKLKELENKIAGRGAAPNFMADETGDTTSIFNPETRKVTNKTLNEMRKAYNMAELPPHEQKTVEDVIKAGIRIANHDGSGMNFLPESPFNGVGGPDAVIDAALMGTPLGPEHQAAVAIHLRTLQEVRDERVRILRDMENPRMGSALKNSLRRLHDFKDNRELRESIGDLNRQIERASRAMKLIGTNAAQTLALRRWADISSNRYNRDGIIERLTAAFRGERSVSGETLAEFEAWIDALAAEEARLEKHEAELREAANPVYESKAISAFEHMRSKESRRLARNDKWYRRLFGKARPVTIAEAVADYAKTLNEGGGDDMPFFKRRVQAANLIKSVSQDADTLTKAIEKLVSEYPDVFEGKEDRLTKDIKDALIVTKEAELSRKRLQLQERKDAILNAKKASTDLKAAVDKFAAKYYNNQNEVTKGLSEFMPDMEAKIQDLVDLTIENAHASVPAKQNAIIQLNSMTGALQSLHRGVKREDTGAFDVGGTRDAIQQLRHALALTEQILAIDGDRDQQRITALDERIEALKGDDPDIAAMFDAADTFTVDPTVSDPELKALREAKEAIGGPFKAELRRLNDLIFKRIDDPNFREDTPTKEESEKSAKKRRARKTAKALEQDRLRKLASDINAVVDLNSSVNATEALAIGRRLYDILEEYPEIAGGRADIIKNKIDAFQLAIDNLSRNKQIQKVERLIESEAKLQREYEKSIDKAMKDPQRMAAIALDADSYRFVELNRQRIEMEKRVSALRRRMDQEISRRARKFEVERHNNWIAKGLTMTRLGLADGWEMGRTLVYMADVSWMMNQLWPYMMRGLSDFQPQKGIAAMRNSAYGPWAGATRALTEAFPSGTTAGDIVIKAGLDISWNYLRNMNNSREDQQQVTRELMDSIIEDPFYQLFKDAGLALSTPGDVQFAEEMFKSDFDRYALLRGYPSGIRDWSEDTMTVAVNMARMAIMKDFYLKHPMATMEDLMKVARHANMATGRFTSKLPGRMSAGTVGDWAGWFLSAPRLLASKIAMTARMSPFMVMGYTGYALAGAAMGPAVGVAAGLAAVVGTEKVAKMFSKNTPFQYEVEQLGRTTRGMMMMYAMLALAGFDIGDDWKDYKNFLKVRGKRVMHDPSGGFAGTIRTVMRLQALARGQEAGTLNQAISDYMFARRLNPAFSVLSSVISGKDFMGNPYVTEPMDIGGITLSAGLLSRLWGLTTILPISVQQIFESVSEGAKISKEYEDDFVEELKAHFENAMVIGESAIGVNAYVFSSPLDTPSARSLPDRIGYHGWRWPTPSYPKVFPYEGIDQERVVKGRVIPFPKEMTGFTDTKVFKKGMAMDALKKHYKTFYEDAWLRMLRAFPEEKVAEIEESVFPGSTTQAAKQERWNLLINGGKGEGSFKGLRNIYKDTYEKQVFKAFMQDKETQSLINALPLADLYVERYLASQ